MKYGFVEGVIAENADKIKLTWPTALLCNIIILSLPKLKLLIAIIF